MLRDSSPPASARTPAASPATAGHRPLVLALAVAACFGAAPARSQPTGAQVLHGSAAIVRNGPSLTVTTQNGAGTQHSAINWQSFSVPAGSSTWFQQPGATSTSINRVVGSDPSSIYGRLGSNGRLVLVNPAGIAVGAGAVVDTAGFTASTLRMSEADAIAGRMRFAGDGASGPLTVQGQVVARGGDVVLIAPNIEVGNQAVVQSPEGATILSAGRAVEITGRGLEGIHFEVQAPGDQAVNLGTLKGDAVGIFANTLRHSGLVQAQAVSSGGGRVVLRANGGDAIVAGKVAATGAEERGGRVDVLGERVGLLAGAEIDTSAPAGGGEVRIGGDYRGQNPDVPNAARTFVSADAAIRANATRHGDGGRVIVWANEFARVHGSISARGGPLGGNGGFIETSSHWLDTGGIRVDTGAPAGRGGTWLLDPAQIRITNRDSGIVDVDTDASADFRSAGGTSEVSAATIAGVLNGGNNVIVDTTSTASNIGDILVESAIAKTAGGDATLTFKAHRNVEVNQSITSTAGILNMVFTPDQDTNGNGAVVLGTATLDANGGTLSAAGKAVSKSTGTTTIQSPFTIGSLALSGGTLAGSGDITVQGAFNVTASSTLAGTGALNTLGTSTLNMPPASAILAVTGGKTWNNAGQINVTGDASIYLGYASGGTNTLNNLAGGTIVLSSSNATPLNHYTGTNTINNAGTLNQVASSTHAIGTGSGLAFNNTGTVNAQTGTLELKAGGTDTGTYTTLPGTVISFAGNAGTTRNLNAGTSITGSGTVRVASGTVNVNGALTTMAGTMFNLAGGTLGGTGSLAINGPFSISGRSTLAGPGLLTTRGTTTVDIPSTSDFVALADGKTWDNAGQLNVTNDDYILFGYSSGGTNTLNNQPGGTIVLSSTNARPLGHYTGSTVINNAGTLNQVASLTHAIGNGNGVAFNNTGTVNAQTGTLAIEGSGTDTGQYTTLAGTVVSFGTNGTTRNLESGVAFSGSGGVRFTGGTVSVNAPLTIPTRLELASGTLTGAGDLATTGAFDLTGFSTITGSGMLTTRGTTTIDVPGSSAFVALSGGKTWTNEGTLNIGGDDALYFGYSSGGNNILRNCSCGTLNLASTHATPLMLYTGTGAVNNLGTLNQGAAGAHTVAGGLAFNNAGTVNVNAGTLAVAGGGTDTGLYAVASGTALDFSGGTRNLDAGSNVTGSGSLSVSGATVRVNDRLDLSTTGTAVYIRSGTLEVNNAFDFGTLNMSGGTLSGSGDVRVTGPFNITGFGTLTGSGLLTTQGATTIDIAAGSSFVALTGGKSWFNEGTLSLAGDDAILFGYATGGANTLVNAAGGTLNLATSHASPLQLWSGTATFHNDGTVNQNATGLHTITGGMAFSNSGTFNVHAGTLSIAGTGVDTGLYTVASGAILDFGAGVRTLDSGSNVTGPGTLSVSGATLNVNGQLDLSTTGTAVNIAGGTFNANVPLTIGTLNMSGGTLGGSGDVTTTGAFNITGAGILTGSGLLATQGTTTIDLAGGSTLVGLTGGKTWNNQGTINLNGDDAIYFGYATGGTNTLNNAAGATLNLNTTNASPLVRWNGPAALHNAGTVNQNAAGAHSMLAGGTIENAGTVHVNAGRLSVDGDGTDTGLYTIAGGSTLAFGSGTRTLAAGSDVTGTGTLAVAGATVRSDGLLGVSATGSGVEVSGGSLTTSNPLAFGNVTISGGTLNLDAPSSIATVHMSSGSLGGSGDVTVSGAFDITGYSSIAGTGQLTTRGTTTIDLAGGPSIVALTGGKTWNNQGTLDLGGDDAIYFGYYTAGANTLNNATGATLNLNTTHAYPLLQWSGPATVNNAGSLNQNAPGVHAITGGVTFNNAGTANVHAGTLALQGDGTDTGLYTVANGATLAISGGTRSLDAGSNVTGTGSLSVSAGTLNVNNLLDLSSTGTSVAIGGGTLNANGPLTFARLDMSGGTLGGTGDVTIAGNFRITGSSMLSGTGGLTTRGATDIDLSGTNNVVGLTGGKTWTNEGVLTLGGDDAIYFGYYTGGTNTLRNAAGGTFRLDSAHPSPLYRWTGIAQLVNEGTLDQYGAATTAVQDISTLSGFRNSGNLGVGQGVLVLPHATTQSGYVQTAAGTTLRVNDGFTNTGTLAGSGTYDVGTGYTLVNEGIIAPGNSAGTLSILGNLDTSNGRIVLEMARTSAYDVVSVSGNVTFGTGSTIERSDLPGAGYAAGDAFDAVRSGAGHITGALPPVSGFSASAAPIAPAPALALRLVAQAPAGAPAPAPTPAPPPPTPSPSPSPPPPPPPPAPAPEPTPAPTPAPSPAPAPATQTDRIVEALDGQVTTAQAEQSVSDMSGQVTAALDNPTPAQDTPKKRDRSQPADDGKTCR